MHVCTQHRDPQHGTLSHSAHQVIELIKRKPREPPAGDFVPDSGTLAGALALEGVVFSYPVRPSQRVLNSLSMTVSPGVRVACLSVTAMHACMHACG